MGTAWLKPSQEAIDRVEALLDDGCSFTEVADSVEGVTLDWIKTNYPGRGWTPEQNNDFLRMLRQYGWVLDTEYVKRRTIVPSDRAVL